MNNEAALQPLNKVIEKYKELFNLYKKIVSEDGDFTGEKENSFLDIAVPGLNELNSIKILLSSAIKIFSVVQAHANTLQGLSKVFAKLSLAIFSYCFDQETSLVNDPEVRSGLLDLIKIIGMDRLASSEAVLYHLQRSSERLRAEVLYSQERIRRLLEISNIDLDAFYSCFVDTTDMAQFLRLFKTTELYQKFLAASVEDRSDISENLWSYLSNQYMHIVVSGKILIPFDHYLSLGQEEQNMLYAHQVAVGGFFTGNFKVINGHLDNGNKLRDTWLGLSIELQEEYFKNTDVIDGMVNDLVNSDHESDTDDCRIVLDIMRALRNASNAEARKKIWVSLAEALENEQLIETSVLAELTSRMDSPLSRGLFGARIDSPFSDARSTPIFQPTKNLLQF